MARRRRYRRKRGGKPLNYRQVKAVGKIARKEIHKGAELKVLDDKQIAVTNIDTTNPTWTLTVPPKGTGNGQRIGDGIYLKSLQFRGDLDCGTNQVNHIRMLMVQDLESDIDGALAISDVLEDTASDNSITSFYKHQPKRKFKVLSDKHYYWDSNTASAPQPYDVCFKNFGKRKIVLDNTSDFGNVGGITLFAIGPASSTADLRNGMARLRYYDM